MDYPTPIRPDVYVDTEDGLGPVEWRRDIQEARPDPDELFLRDSRIGNRYTLEGRSSSAVSIDQLSTAIVEGIDWAESRDFLQEDAGLHCLRAVVNVGSENYGIATTRVDDQEVTYITRFGEKPQEAALVGILNQTEEGGYFTVSSLASEHDELFTVFRTPSGELSVYNKSTSPMAVGVGKEKSRDAESFSFRNVFKGIKRALRGDQPAPDRNVLSGSMAWMTPSGDVAKAFCWMQEVEASRPPTYASSN